MASKRSNLFSKVERAYGRALLELAEQADQLDAVGDEIRQLRDLLQQQPDVTRLLSSRSVPTPARLDSAGKLFKEQVSELTLKFISVLVVRNRFDEFPGIAAAFIHMVEEKHGQVEAEATVAYELDDEATRRVAQRLGSMLNRQVLLTQELDPSLIGGIKLRVGDEVYDGSIATQLQIMRQRLIDQGREKARQLAESL